MTLLRAPAPKSKHEATTDKATDVFGCTCTEPRAPPSRRARRSPTLSESSHQLVAQASSLVCRSQASVYASIASRALRGTGPRLWLRRGIPEASVGNSSRRRAKVEEVDAVIPLTVESV